MGALENSLEVLAGLRRWAQGAASDLAAVELLAGLGYRQWVDHSCAWMRPCRRPGWYWLDADLLATAAEPLTEKERRVLAVVAALLTEETCTPIDYHLALRRDAA